MCLGGSVLSLVEMVYYFTLRLFNRIVSILQKDHPPTRQTSPIKHKSSLNEKQGYFLPLKKSTVSDSKLQTFGKNVNMIGYEPFGVHETKNTNAIKKMNGHATGAERYYLK